MAQDRRITKTKAANREAFFSILKDDKSAKITVTEITKRANIDLYRHIAKMPCYASFGEKIKDIVKSVVVETLSEEVNIPKDELELYAEFYAAGIIAVNLKWLRNEVNLTETEVINILSTASFYGFQKLLQQK